MYHFTLNVSTSRGHLLFVAYNQLSTTLYFMHMHIAHASFFRTCAIHAFSIPTNCILHYFVFKCGTLSRGVPIHGPPAWKSVECAAAQLSWIGIRPTELNWRVTFPLLYALGISILTGTELRVRNLRTAPAWLTDWMWMWKRWKTQFRSAIYIRADDRRATDDDEGPRDGEFVRMVKFVCTSTVCSVQDCMQLGLGVNCLMFNHGRTSRVKALES